MERTAALILPRPRFFNRCLILACLWAAGFAPATGAETYLLVERPAALVVYDQYQQILSTGDRAALGSFVPFHVLRARSVLGDGITPCVAVDLEGNTYYLLRDAGDRLAGESRAGRIQWYTDATPLGDTVTILRPADLEVPWSRAPHPVQAGEHLIRVFRLGTKTYVAHRDAAAPYGWLSLEERDRGRSWSPPVVIPQAPPVVTGPMTQEIQSRVAEANRVLSGLFTYFNTSLHAKRQPPRWTVQASGDSLLCALEGTTSPETFSESTKALVREIENVLLGSRLRVVTSPGRILIQPG